MFPTDFPLKPRLEKLGGAAGGGEERRKLGRTKKREWKSRF